MHLEACPTIARSVQDIDRRKTWEATLTAALAFIDPQQATDAPAATKFDIVLDCRSAIAQESAVPDIAYPEVPRVRP
jgi:hypothetical protein